jgi:DNA-binding Xre family transcriptional regulator
MGVTAVVPVRFRLSALLEEAGISQRALAERSGVSPTIVNRMANNLATQVSLRTLDSLCAALGDVMGRAVEPGELLERDGPARRRGRG